MENTKWRWILDGEHNYKGHVVSENLATCLVNELIGRSAAEGYTGDFSNEPLDGSPHFDAPGMIWIGRSVRTISFGELVMEVPSEDWYYTYSKLKVAPVRYFGTEPYYKIHSWRFCVVFDPDQRQAVLKQMEDQMDAADAEATHDIKRMRETIADVNKQLGREAIVTSTPDPDVKGVN
jgi:hypothetical protein